jgi:hypothetical protein
VVQHVKEVSLSGRADLEYWRGRLQPEGLAPFAVEGCAELVLIAADMVWMGQRFTELSVSVAITRGSASRDGMFLIQAFNAIRPLAWAERVFFQTPYFHARTTVSLQPPIGFTLHAGNDKVLSAALDAGRAPASRGPATVTGPIYLPAALTRTPRAEKLFYAKLSGDTAEYPAAFGDRLHLSPNPRTPVVQWLIDSGFVPHTWYVRPNAVHKKSPTTRAPAAL